MVGKVYNQAITATGGVGTVTLSLFPPNQALPPGINFAGSAFSGTPTSTTGSPFGITVRASDTGGPPTDKTYNLTVLPELIISTSGLPAGTVGVPYSLSLAGSGGITPYTYSAANLPPNLTISTGGVISGTPTTAGTTSIIITLFDGSNPQFRTEKTLSLTINPAPTPLSITTPSPLPSAIANAGYTQTFAATGGSGSGYTFAIAAGSNLPSGLALSGGVLSGIPTNPASPASFNLQVTDSAATTSTKTFQLTIHPALAISNTSPLPNATANAPYQQGFTASGGSGSGFAWSLAPGSNPLPPGLMLSAGGTLSGTPTTAASPVTFVIQVTDASNSAATATRTFQLTINPAGPALTISTASLPGWTAGAPYSQTLTATGGSGSYSWTTAPGSSLPPNLTIAPATGTISGTPTTAGSTSFTAVVTDSTNTSSSKPFTILINPAPQITTTSLAGGTVGSTYSASVLASGGTAPFTWTISAASLPPQLSISSAGVISGSLTTAGNFPFTVRLSDAAGAIAEKALAINVASSGLTITTTALANGVAGTGYSQTLTAAGGSGTGYVWSATGSLPTGLSLSPGGTISGTSSTAGTFPFTVQVTDSTGNAATKPLSITIAGTPITITTPSPLGQAQINTLYAASLSASGGSGQQYRWSLAGGALPGGIALNENGQITGTPTAAGTFNFTVQVVDSLNTTAAKLFRISVVAVPLTITSSSPLPDATLGVSYTHPLQATGGTGAGYNFQLLGSLPAGMALLSNGAIGGAPTSAGTQNFTIQLNDDGGGQTSKPFSITVTASNLTISTAALPAASTSSPYSATLQASGGSTPYSWSVAVGILPPGLTLSAATGVISGTATQIGSYNFRAQVRDANSLTASREFTLQVASFGITTQSLPDATVGVAYSQTLTAVGGTGPFTWSVPQGSLPQGLTLTSAGQITGIPTQVSPLPVNFVVQVRDSQNVTATQPLSMRVSSNLNISNASLAGATVGTSYNQQLQASGGVAPFSWIVTAGALPVGVSLNAGTGIISGIPTTTAQSPFNFTIQVTDATNSVFSKQFTIAVSPPTAAPPTISTASPLANITPGAFFSQTLQATGGSAPYTWSLSGILPQGISLSNNGVLSGTTTQSGTYTFTVQVMDAANQIASKPLTVTVGATSSPLQISTTSLPNASLNAVYPTTALAASGGTPPYAWSVQTGTLPPGINLAGGVVSGTPTAAGVYPFTIQASDASQPAQTATRSFTITVSQGLAITTATLSSGVQNQPYPATLLSAAGGTGSGYAWSIIGGQLPAGMSLSTSGLLTGTPTLAGTVPVTIQVTDSAGGTASRQFSVVITPSNVVTVTTSQLTNGIVGNAYSSQLQAQGGTTPYLWSVTSALPPGLSLSTSGLLAGTPVAAGNFVINARVQDATGQTAIRELGLTVAAAALSISTQTLPAAIIGVAYNFGLLASGAAQPVTWSVKDGNLPPGFTLVPSSGLLTGIATLQGSYLFTAQLVDGQGNVTTRQLTLAVNPVLSVNTNSLAGGTPGQIYNQALQATGGSANGYNWTLISGTLPAGLTLTAASGVISGVPTAAGASNFTVQVADSAGSFASKALSIAIETSLSITTESLPNAATTALYNQTISAAGGMPPLQWSVIAGALPPGVTLSPAAGTITGTPTAAGTYAFTLRVQDANNTTAARAFSITVLEGLQIATPTALPNGAEGAPYSQTLGATGGRAPYTWSVTVGSVPPGLSLSAASGLISGTPAIAGSYSFIVQIADGQQQTLQKAFTLIVTGRISIVTPATLPSATVRQAYSEVLEAAGGSPPYTWTLASGSPPIGISMERNGVVSGTPSSAGAFNFTVQVSDGQGVIATRTFSLTVSLSLAVTTAPSLTAGTAGAPYSLVLAAAGGQPPYSWSLATGPLPAGLSLSSSGVLSGVPTAAGTFQFGALVADNTGNNATASFTVTIRLPSTPSVSILGLADSIEPAQQPRLNLSLGSAYPVPITGTLTLTFNPDAAVPVDDPAVVFSNGSRTVNFTIPANSTLAQLPEGFAMQTGTVAGTLSLAATLRASGQDITPSPAPGMTAKLNRTSPVIRSLTARRVAGGLEVTITGYATSREVGSGTFRFTGNGLQTSELTVQLHESAQRWYQSDASRPFGSQFTLTQQFNVQGDTSAISSVSVTLVNPQGTSQPTSANFQ